MFLIEMRLREGEWQSAHIPHDRELTEDEAEHLITLYRRAMPAWEYRKREIRDEDIPF